VSEFDEPPVIPLKSGPCSKVNKGDTGPKKKALVTGETPSKPMTKFKIPQFGCFILPLKINGIIILLTLCFIHSKTIILTLASIVVSEFQFPNPIYNHIHSIQHGWGLVGVVYLGRSLLVTLFFFLFSDEL